jgi:hypothetical protein
LLLVGAEWLADGDFRIVEVAPLGALSERRGGARFRTASVAS